MGRRVPRKANRRPAEVLDRRLMVECGGLGIALAILPLSLSGLGCGAPSGAGAGASNPSSTGAAAGPESAPAAASASPAVSATAIAPESTSAHASASATPPASNAPGTAGQSPAGAAPEGGTVLIGDIVSGKSFEPKPVLETLKPEFLRCYANARASHADLHGKVKLRIVINEAGSVQSVSAVPGGTADDPTLVGCLGDALKTAQFPKPPGNATILAPMVFHR